MTGLRVHLIGLVLTAFFTSFATASYGAEIQGSEVGLFFDLGLPSLVERTAHPEGGRIFQLWSRETGEPLAAGILFSVDGTIDFGTPVSARIDAYLATEDLHIRGITVSPDDPVALDSLQEYFERVAEIRYCAPEIADDVAVDTSYVRSYDPSAPVKIAVFPGERIVAHVSRETGLVEELRWIKPSDSLEGCP